uniref:Uncharacterized protein n=1 Tax=Anopheles merus TaxID=30066 RepID=A0A182VAL6_ANOME
MSTVQDHVATTVAAATAAMVGCLVLAGVIGSVGPAVNGFKGAYRNDHYVQGAACKGCLLRFGLARKSQPMPSFIPQNVVAQRVEKFAPPHAASAHRVSEALRVRPILTRRRSLLPPDPGMPNSAGTKPFRRLISIGFLLVVPKGWLVGWLVGWLACWPIGAYSWSEQCFLC